MQIKLLICYSARDATSVDPGRIIDGRSWSLIGSLDQAFAHEETVQKLGHMILPMQLKCLSELNSPLDSVHAEAWFGMSIP